MKQYRQFRRTEGLSNNNIYAVYPDAHGNLWMSSDYGLMQFHTTRFTTRAYFVEDGITHNEFNRIAHFQEPDGRMYFGGLNGITAFHPGDFGRANRGPGCPCALPRSGSTTRQRTRWLTKQARSRRPSTITLLPDDRSSVLDFALLNYANPEKNVYAYQLEDLDGEWTYQPEPSLRLSNLPYGAHQLLIRAQAADGQWSANTLSINLVVMRPFYLRPWFLLGVVLAVGAGLWAWVRWRVWHHKVNQLRLETQIRQATARMEEDKDIIEQAVPRAAPAPRVPVPLFCQHFPRVSYAAHGHPGHGRPPQRRPADGTATAREGGRPDRTQRQQPAAAHQPDPGPVQTRIRPDAPAPRAGRPGPLLPLPG
jgi:hypothetical protein